MQAVSMGWREARPPSMPLYFARQQGLTSACQHSGVYCEPCPRRYWQPAVSHAVPAQRRQQRPERYQHLVLQQRPVGHSLPKCGLGGRSSLEMGLAAGSDELLRGQGRARGRGTGAGNGRAALLRLGLSQKRGRSNACRPTFSLLHARCPRAYHRPIQKASNAHWRATDKHRPLAPSLRCSSSPLGCPRSCSPSTRRSSCPWSSTLVHRWVGGLGG